MQVGFFEGTETEELAQVFAELHRHYAGALAPSLETVSDNLRDSVLAPSSSVRVVVARSDGQIAGMATFAVLYPAPDAKGQLFMKDLYVRDRWRGQGVGEAIMSFLARNAIESGCVRFDWTTELGNTGAMAFYESIGATRITEKVYYRIAGEALQKFACRSVGATGRDQSDA